jgi:tetratricopeptide (TPR) repeat protein
MVKGLRRYRLELPALAFAALLLGACAGTQPEPTASATAQAPEDVELTLNLPDATNGCVCDAPADQDHTFLERGMQTLAAGDYIEAVQYFQRYQRLEQTAIAKWEGELAIAYVSMLPSSPFYDVDAAQLAYADLQAREPEGAKHHSIVLMQQALESFVLMERHVADLESRATMLREDLEKREQALKRLRELTLGQPTTPQ